MGARTVICVDFDGTCVLHKYPVVGEDVPMCVDVLKELTDKGVYLVLFTMRGGEHLKDAVDWFKENNIPLWGIQTNPDQKSWTDSPKAYGQVYIDDAALGCPLVFPKEGRPYVDWFKVKTWLKTHKVL